MPAIASTPITAATAPAKGDQGASGPARVATTSRTGSASPASASGTSAILAPFGRPFSAPTEAALRGRTLLFPNRFGREHEVWRFVAPGVEIHGYGCDTHGLECLPPQDVPAGTLAAAVTIDRRPLPGWEILEERAHLRQRHTPAQIAQIVRGDLTLLVDRLAIVRRLP